MSRTSIAGNHGEDIRSDCLVTIRLTSNGGIKLNLEMAASQEMLNTAIKVKPYLVTLVPEKSQELTTEGGLDILGNKKKLIPFVSKLKNKNIRVSIFVNPDRRQIEAAKNVGANVVEIHTGIYAEDFLKGKNFGRELKRIKEAGSGTPVVFVLISRSLDK